MMKVTTLSFVLFWLAGAAALSQQDPEAKKILDRVSQKNKDYKTIQVDFELKIENKRDDLNTSSSGTLKIKGEKYYMESAGSKVYYDGTTLWNYMEDINEVSISEPDKGSGDFVDNPALIFDFYNRDFKYRLRGEIEIEGIPLYEIDLYPNNLDQPYSRFKILIIKNPEQLYMVSALGKDGVDYTAVLRNIKYDQTISDEEFTFNPEKHKGIEIIDLRF